MGVRTRVINGWRQRTGVLRRVFSTGSYDYVCTGTQGMHITTGDVTDNWEEDNPFSSDRQIRRCGVMDGQTPLVGSPTRIAIHCPITGMNWTLGSPRAVFDTPDLSAMRLYWLGSLTPQSGGLNVPAAVLELKDVPQMLIQIPALFRKWGQWRFSKRISQQAKAAQLLSQVAGDAGGLYLGAKFGWDPLQRDLLSILGMLQSIQDYLRMLERLRGGRTIKRTLRIAPRKVTQDSGRILVHSAGISVYAKRAFVYDEASWVTSRWSPLVPLMYRGRSDEDLLRKALRDVPRLTLGGAVETWWELLPWSWLIDWFAGIQQRLGALVRNSMLLKCESLCYCRTTSLRILFSNVELPAGITYDGDHLAVRVLKERTPLLAQLPPEVPTPSLPVLRDSQVAILTALAAQLLSSR